MSSPNKARLRLWVRALRSGQYQQGRVFMRDDNNRYCCLGVAMDLAIANGCDVVVAPGNWGKTATMPKAIGDWFGLSQPGSGHNDPGLREVGSSVVRAASALNDEGVSFSDIADRISYTFNLDSDEESSE